MKQGKCRGALAAAVAIIMMAGTARAEVTPGALSWFNAAYAQFELLLPQARSRGTLPRLAVPHEAHVLSRLWDVDALFRRPPYTLDDVAPLLDVMEKQHIVLRTYLTHTADPQARPNLAQNFVTYQDEVAQALAAQINGWGAVIAARNDMLRYPSPETLAPEDQSKLREFRTGVLEVLGRAVLLLRVPEIRPATQATITAALGEHADAIAGLMTRRDRTMLDTAMEAALPAMPAEAQRPAKLFISAMRESPCRGLCALN